MRWSSMEMTRSKWRRLKLFSAFAKVETKLKEYRRARVIYKVNFSLAACTHPQCIY